MQLKLLKEIVSSISGPSSARIVDLLYEKKNVNVFLIAKKLNLTINQTRNILYKLAEEGLVSFVRKKDNKKGGWYTYFWTLSPGKSLSKFREIIEKRINEIQGRIVSKRKGMFFYCKNCDLEYDEESALINNYTCRECGEPLELKEMSGEILELEKEIERLSSLLGEVGGELTTLEASEKKSKERKAKLEEKKKKEEREKKRKERAVKKKKEMKVSSKGKKQKAKK